MPMFTVAVAIAGGAIATPLTTWQFRFPPKPSLLEVFCNATAVGLVQNLTTGPESIVQAESVVSAGGTAGVLPSRFDVEPIVDAVDQGEEIVHTIRNTTGGAITFNGVYILTYKAI